MYQVFCTMSCRSAILKTERFTWHCTPTTYFIIFISAKLHNTLNITKHNSTRELYTIIIMCILHKLWVMHITTLHNRRWYTAHVYIMVWNILYTGSYRINNPWPFGGHDMVTGCEVNNSECKCRKKEFIFLSQTEERNWTNLVNIKLTLLKKIQYYCEIKKRVHNRKEYIILHVI